MKKEQIFQEFYSAFLHCMVDRNISPRDLKDDLNDKLTWKLQEAIRARLERRDQTVRKPGGTRKAMPEQTLTRRTSKTMEGKQAPQLTRRQPALTTELKCYNCFEPEHIVCNCPKPKTEKTKQILVAKLVEVSTRGQPEQESEGK
ncbi:hypothetical protein GP486_008758, partial [Trichoglossum hirsutum]